MVKQEHITIKLDELQAPQRNVRMHPTKQIAEIIRSLDKFGQCRDLVLDEDNVVLAGNGLWTAMAKRGDTEASAIRLIGLSDKEKLKFMLADNKTFSLGVEDLDGVNAVLEQLGADLDVPGYDEDTLKVLVATADEVTDKLMEYGTIDERQIENIRSRGERRDIQMQQGIEQHQPPQSIMSKASEELQTGEDPANEDRAFVICPKCGERIWL